MSRQEVLNEVKQMAVQVSENGTAPPFLQERINALYKIVFDREVKKCNCTDKYFDAVFEMLNYLNHNKTMKTEIKCKMKGGALIHFDGNCYTNENITDDIAIAILNKFPTAEKYFNVLPKIDKKPKRKPLYKKEED